jgi:acetyl esterase/lipase
MLMNKHLSALLALVFGLALALSVTVECATPRQETGSATSSPGETFTVEEKVLYATVNGTELHLDVYAPAGHATGTRPAVVLIHGGGWSSLDRHTMRGMGGFLARSGFVCFAVDYRLFQDKQNPWPAQLDDVQRAVRWVRAHAARYGVNPDRIGAFGHSAGAQLAALLGMEETRDNSDPALARYSSKVQAVVDVSGPTDFTRDQDSEAGAEFLTNFLDASYAQHPEVWRNASPAFHVAKDDAPFLIVHGTQDESVPIAQAQELYQKLQAAGVPAAFIKVNDAHTFQSSEARRELAIETLSFFNRYLVVGH